MALTALSTLQSACNYIAAVTGSGLGDVDKTIEHQANHLATRFSQMKFDTDAATPIILALQSEDSPFSLAQRSHLVSLVTTNVEMHAGAASARHDGAKGTHQQNCLSIEHALTDHLWVMCFSQDESVPNKLEAASQHFVKGLRLTNPCEKTRQRLVAIVLCCAKLDVSPEVGYDYVDKFRQFMEVHRACSAKKAAGPSVYPTTTEEFRNILPDCNVVNSKLECVTINIKVQQVPCRSSDLRLRSSEHATVVAKRRGSKMPEASQSLMTMSKTGEFVVPKEAAMKMLQTYMCGGNVEILGPKSASRTRSPSASPSASPTREVQEGGHAMADAAPVGGLFALTDGAAVAGGQLALAGEQRALAGEQHAMAHGVPGVLAQPEGDPAGVGNIGALRELCRSAVSTHLASAAAAPVRMKRPAAADDETVGKVEPVAPPKKPHAAASDVIWTRPAAASDVTWKRPAGPPGAAVMDRNGWAVETRTRGTGQSAGKPDRYFWSPAGKRYTSRIKAEAAGFEG